MTSRCPRVKQSGCQFKTRENRVFWKGRRRTACLAERRTAAVKTLDRQKYVQAKEDRIFWAVFWTEHESNARRKVKIEIRRLPAAVAKRFAGRAPRAPRLRGDSGGELPESQQRNRPSHRLSDRQPHRSAKRRRARRDLRARPIRQFAQYLSGFPLDEDTSHATPELQKCIRFFQNPAWR